MMLRAIQDICLTLMSAMSAGISMTERGDDVLIVRFYELWHIVKSERMPANSYAPRTHCLDPMVMGSMRNKCKARLVEDRYLEVHYLEICQWCSEYLNGTVEGDAPD